MYALETTPQFDTDIESLDLAIALRILKKIKWLRQNPEVLRFGLKHMPKDLRGLQKYQIGDYRVLLWVDHSMQTITLYGVEHRRSVYRRLK